MAVGLGSMDMPVPAVAEWEWLNWKFPRAVRAGDTIYARWTLTQKRAPVGGSSTAIVVWRVDVHTASGTLCAEGEVGASVLRGAQAGTAGPAALETVAREPAAEPVAAAGSGATTPRRGRRRRRTTGSDPAKPKATVTAEAVVQAAPSPAAPTGSERTANARRRRRRRPATSAAARNGDNPSPTAPMEAPVPAATAPATTAPATANPLTRAIRRLRRP